MSCQRLKSETSTRVLSTYSSRSTKKWSHWVHGQTMRDIHFEFLARMHACPGILFILVAGCYNNYKKGWVSWTELTTSTSKIIKAIKSAIFIIELHAAALPMDMGCPSQSVLHSLAQCFILWQFERLQNWLTSFHSLSNTGACKRFLLVA